MPPVSLRHDDDVRPCLGHAIGHECPVCDAIRRAGPQLATPHWPALIADVLEAPTTLTPASARARTRERQRAARREVRRRERLRAALLGHRVGRVGQRA